MNVTFRASALPVGGQFKQNNFNNVKFGQLEPGAFLEKDFNLPEVSLIKEQLKNNNILRQIGAKISEILEKDSLKREQKFLYASSLMSPALLVFKPDKDYPVGSDKVRISLLLPDKTRLGKVVFQREQFMGSVFYKLSGLDLTSEQEESLYWRLTPVNQLKQKQYA